MSIRCLVTGGAGFIGSHLVERLVRDGHRVRVVDNLITGFRHNLAAVAAEVEFIEGALEDPATAQQAVAGVEVIFHEAALPSVPRSVQDPFTSQRCGEVATLTLLAAAARAGSVRRVIYASSSSIYGDTPTLPKVETMPPRPLSPYAATKLAGEGYMAAYAALSGMDTLCLRYFNVFGPRQDPNNQYAGVIARFVQVMARGEPPTIYGDGTATRDFTPIANVVQANLLAMNAPGRFQGEVFNIACGRQISLQRLVQQLNALFGTDLNPIHAAPRPGDIAHSCADITKASRLLGYSPRVDFETGLRELVYQTPRL
ncbi:NAD-dependent epimerase/dehydratase family protein [Chloracidobacterium aggregatum]|uniref:NAD-dependent epimerase/dehydratase family protein n=1 Tax=Chloracidobacterium sp. N TaxID=2821540 RepID=A0ABX8B7P2_9BACT|nr:NAD-dependent epimerase/dehydratase family protein [Chloracidobacterium aggregatum]QUV85883.1 NAD-dependent epimerase/dehydratase family protein [Chloracidobacterium sp. 2]QUV89696.1 NAD-dependent epimerase/dehydratase family protein [Chloracidobacterium sp. S]QUV92312.1 NAD-dependent epimerase/dehydratase family protein [Chloracidobacterium sp. A]QUV95586.1 NAD-dependent epimerase/dehydratase family protein [Chloracidobacterium sp. N]QUV98809.1 NAD-dependent epimerase/dehydratase family pr